MSRLTSASEKQAHQDLNRAVTGGSAVEALRLNGFDHALVPSNRIFEHTG
jgi:hypothetical protein